MKNIFKIAKTKYKHTKKHIEKKDFLQSLIIFLAFGLRIPRTLYPNGHDAFEIIWIAQAINKGALFSDNTWIIHPFSIFGFYPFSHYPVGTSLFLSFFLLIGVSISLSIYLCSTIFFLIGVIGVVKLSDELFEQDKLKKNLFLLVILVGSNDYYKYTYYTLSPRGILVSISMWFFLYVFRFLKKFNFKQLLKAIITLLLMPFFHRISFIYIIVLVNILIIVIAKKIKVNQRIKNFLSKKFILVFLFCTSLSLLIVGFQNFQITTGSIYFLNQKSPNNNFLLFLSLALNYIVRNGILFIFFPLGLVVLWFKKDIMEKHARLFLILCSFFLNYVWTKQIYSIMTFLPYFGVITVLGISEISKVRFKGVNLFNLKILSLVIVSISFIVAIILSLYFVPLLQFFYCSFILTLFSLLFYILILKKRSSEKDLALAIILIALGSSFFTLSMVESRENRLTLTLYPNVLDYSQAGLTVYEKRVADYINEQGCKGIVLIADKRIEIARRIGGYGFLPTLPGDHIVGQQIYYQWISKEYVKNHTRFDFKYFLSHFELMYFGINFEETLYETVYKLQIRSRTEFFLLEEYNIQYVVAVSGSELTPLVNSLRFITPDYENEYLEVWKIF